MTNAWSHTIAAASSSLTRATSSAVNIRAPSRYAKPRFNPTLASSRSRSSSRLLSDSMSGGSSTRQRSGTRKPIASAIDATMISATSGNTPWPAPRSLVKRVPCSVSTTTGHELPRKSAASTPFPARVGNDTSARIRELCADATVGVETLERVARLPHRVLQLVIVRVLPRARDIRIGIDRPLRLTELLAQPSDLELARDGDEIARQLLVRHHLIRTLRIASPDQPRAHKLIDRKIDDGIGE